jgi:hypothetical protein
MKLRQVLLPGEKRSCQRLALTLTGLLLLAGVVAAAVSINVVAGRSAAVVIGQPFQDEVRIELSSTGFTPSAVQHAAGTFGITVENSGLAGEYTLRLKSEDGAVLTEVPVQKGSAGWTVTLQPGAYTLTEASNPQWLCQITVQ